MNRVQTWAVHASNLAVGGTGLVYGWMRYFAESDDPFAIANHPWQPHLQHGHILTAPLLVFAGGLIFTSHVLHHYGRGTRRGRRTGITLAALFVPMVVSGYALQVSVEELWRDVWIVLHLVTSLTWLLMAAVHPFLKAPAQAESGSPQGLREG